MCETDLHRYLYEKLHPVFYVGAKQLGDEQEIDKSSHDYNLYPTSSSQEIKLPDNLASSMDC